MSDYILNNSEINLEEIKDKPSINIPDKLYSIFELQGIEEYRKKFDTYNYNNIPIPRVSNILDQCINKPYLVQWAASLGYRNYAIEKNKALTIGTRTHEAIENYLTTNTDVNIGITTPPSLVKYVKKAYNNFKAWVDNLHHLGYHIDEVIAIEKPLSCPYYGGTTDCILRINGKVYLVDFKTSKKISYEYLVQVCAYMWLINNGYSPDLPHIDGVGIIRVDKETNKFEDYFLNESDPIQNSYINSYIQGFGSLLSSFYHQINMQSIFNTYKKDYSIEDALPERINPLEI